MGILINTDTEYKNWISELKQRIRQSQIKAAVKVNTELIHMYWELGKDIVKKQAEAKWGSGFLKQLSTDLTESFPDMQGFSKRNLEHIRKWYLFYNQTNSIAKQVVSQLDDCIFQIPWGHHIMIMTKCTSIDEALFYIHKTIEQGWSRNVLMHYISIDLYRTEGKSISNFKNTLPSFQSDLTQQTLKDPYNFDFLTMRDGYRERELEDALTDNITKFLLELGSGFAYVGRQVRLEVGRDEFFVDLLFYHLKLRCYVVIELKTGDFQPEYVSKLGFYISAINHEMKHSQDNPTIGLLICKNKNDIVAQYTLDTTNLPIGISEYELSKLYPNDIKSSLPSIEDIENELKEQL